MAYNKIATYYDYLMEVVDYNAWFTHYNKLLAKKSVQTVVELGAGTGNFTLRLAEFYDVHAVERSKQMIDIARAKTKDVVLKHRLTFENTDMLSFKGESPEQTFDAAVAVFDVLNYCLTIHELEELCAHTASKLQPGGLFLFDVNTKAAFENNLFDEDITNPETGYSHVWRGNYDPETQIVRVEMKFYQNGQFQFREIQHQRAHTQIEITEALKKAGFTQIDFYNAIDMSEPHDMTDRWLVSAMRFE